MRHQIVKDICTKFNVFPTVDLFAAPSNERFPKFMTSSSDAMQIEWEHMTAWIHPPWRLWPVVLEKLLQSRCTAVCVAPAWREEWVQRLISRATRKQFYPAGMKFFELHGKVCKPLKWGVWIALLELEVRSEGSPPPTYDQAMAPAPTIHCPLPEPTPNDPIVPVNATAVELDKPSKSAKRLKRRKALKERLTIGEE